MTKTLFLPIAGTYISTPRRTTSTALIAGYVGAEQRRSRALGLSCKVTHDCRIIVDGREVAAGETVELAQTTVIEVK